jgi:hypothetical protein
MDEIGHMVFCGIRWTEIDQRRRRGAGSNEINKFLVCKDHDAIIVRSIVQEVNCEVFLEFSAQIPSSEHYSGRAPQERTPLRQSMFSNVLTYVRKVGAVQAARELPDTELLAGSRREYTKSSIGMK